MVSRAAIKKAGIAGFFYGRHVRAYAARSVATAWPRAVRWIACGEPMQSNLLLPDLLGKRLCVVVLSAPGLRYCYPSNGRLYVYKKKVIVHKIARLPAVWCHCALTSA
jgi:hypothetical protein